MSTIPRTPPNVPTPGSKRRVQIPTYGGGLTARNTYNAPGQMGTGLSNIIENVTETAQQIDTRLAISRAEQKGFNEQEKNPNYVAPGPAFTVTGEAYQKGANTAFITRKEKEYKSKLSDIAFKNQNDVTKYNEATEDYKNKFLATIPSNLQTDLSQAFDESAFNIGIRLDGEIKRKQYESDRDEIKQEYQDLAFAITNILEASDMEQDPTSGEYWTNGTGYADTFAKMKSLEMVLRESFGQTDYEMFNLKKEARMPILTALVTKELNSRMDDPTARDKFIEDFKSGNYNMSNFGEVYGSVIPGSSKISASERFLLGQELDTYKETVLKQNKQKLSEVFSNNKGYGDQIRNGKIYTRDANGKLIMKNLDDVKRDDLIAYGATEDQIRDQMVLREADKIVGGYTYQAIINSNTSQTKLLADITAQKILVEKSDLPDKEKIVMLQAYDDATAQVQATYKEKIDFMNNGEHWEYAAQKLDVAIDPTDESTLDRDLPQIAQMFNLPRIMIPAPKEASGVMWQGWANMTDDRTAVGYLLEQKQKYGKYFGSMIVTGSKYNSEDNEGMVASVIADIGQNSTGPAVYLNNAYREKERYLEQAEQRSGANWSKVKDKAEENFQSTFADKLDPESPFYNAIQGTFDLVYYREVSRDGNSDRALASATNFVNNNFVTLSASNGSQVMTPKYIYDKDGNQVNTQKVVDMMEAILENPHKFNIKLAQGETLNDFQRNKSNYQFGWNNGGLTFYQKGDFGFEAVRIYQKLPSDQNQLLYADTLFAVGDDSPLVTSDSEKSWNMDIDPKWLDKWTYKSTVIKPITDEMGNIDYVSVAKDNEKWAREYSAYWIDTTTVPQMIQNNPNAPIKVATYEDSFVATLFPAYAGNEDKNRLAIGNAISMGLRSPNLKKETFERMSMWLANNSEYADVLNNQRLIDRVWQKWKGNLDTYASKQTFNDAPTTMTVLQSFIDLARDENKILQQIISTETTQQTGA